MNTLPERSNLDHLRKQAKDLLRSYRANDPAAVARLRANLPDARGLDDATIAARQFRLHDMQVCIAREYGSASWNDLKERVELQAAQARSHEDLTRHWLRLVYGGDVAGGPRHARPALAARVLAEHPALVSDDALLACAVGDEARVLAAIEADAGWVNRPGGLLRLPPLIAVTHSSLARAGFAEPLRRCLRLLLDRGADPNTRFHNRFPPASVEQPGEETLTAIYGAAGKLHDVPMTAMLLAAGADANDNESLYHSIDDPDTTLPCTRLLLEAGTRVAGTNALSKVLDFDNLAGLELLLRYTSRGHADLGRALHWAVYRGRSAAHVHALLAAGADAHLPPQNHDLYRHAASMGLPEVMRLLEQRGDGAPLNDAERFVTACARGDASEARRLKAAQPEVFASLTPAQLKQLPNLAMAGRDDAVRLMVELGWPIDVRGGDIDGSALNWAVFRGRPELADFLFRHGADYHEPHGYGSDVLGTLGWASLNQPRADGDWPACASVMRAHGLPRATLLPERDPVNETRTLAIDGRTLVVPAEVADVLLE